MSASRHFRLARQVRQRVHHRAYTIAVAPQLGPALHIFNLPALFPSAPVPPSAREQPVATLETTATPQSGRRISLEELRQHTSADSCWLVYAGSVYDVTEFLSAHPGGAAAILFAAGQDLELFWQHYPIHYRKNALATLEQYCIGHITEEDQEELRQPEKATEGKLTTASRRFWDTVPAIVEMSAVIPFWLLIRSCLRAWGMIVPWLGRKLSDWSCRMLPVSVPGYGPSAQLKPGARVAVVGGGIAGVGCAYMLTQSGYDVTVYETREQLGGNAQVGTFDHEGKQVTQDLSVLFWAPEYYKNYCALLSRLGVEPEEVNVAYALCTNQFGEELEYFTPPGSKLHQQLPKTLEIRFAEDLKRYDSMVGFCRKVNNFFAWGNDEPSFYKMAGGALGSVNPLNFVSNRWLSRRFGLSDDFYHTIVQPFHGIQFTTLQIEHIPAVAFPALDDIVPLTSSRTHGSWGALNSTEVFEKATEECKVVLNRRVLSVEFDDDTGCNKLIDDQGETCEYERVVFACPAHAAANMMQDAGRYESRLLKAVGYHDDYHNHDWKDWLEAPVHQDVECLPDGYRRELMDGCAFMINTDAHGGADGTQNTMYTHVLGSWSPSAREAGIAGAPMFMSQCMHEGVEIDEAKINKTFSAPRSHPDLSTSNLAITQMLRLVQGRKGRYFCSNYVAPGNGHDLSLLSGMAVAGAIGAEYPFPENQSAWQDFEWMKMFMGV